VKAKVSRRCPQKPIAAEGAGIADLADPAARPSPPADIGRVGILAGLSSSEADPQVDLGHLETGDLEAEIETAEREVLELLGQQPIVPGRNLSQPVIGDHEGTGLPRVR